MTSSLDDSVDGAGVVVDDDGLARPAWAAVEPLLRDYYDNEWGMPITDERSVFERISLEAFQAGLSWVTILRKRPAFRLAFDDFDPDAVAAYDHHHLARLLADRASAEPGALQTEVRILPGAHSRGTPG